MFDEKDLNQMADLGISPETVMQQLTYFRKGFPYCKLLRPAILNDGIFPLNEEKIGFYINTYNSESGNCSILKFVPASGAATRMFKDLYAFIEEKEEIEENIAESRHRAVMEALSQLESFAFYQELSEKFRDFYGYEIALQPKKQDLKKVAGHILNSEGLNYGSLPKALIKFHKYPGEVRTSFEEHLAEGAMYSVSCNDEVHIHFTLTGSHISLVSDLFNRVKNRYEQQYNIKYNISYSVQKTATDTIAAGTDNNPFRNSDGSLLFRPGGHGALIGNLFDTNAGVVFIKNIDNVVIDSFKSETVKYKKAIGGLLVYVRNKIFHYLKKIEARESSDNLKNEIVKFYLEYFHKDLCRLSFDDLFEILNRPIRVCGMVKNLGEPGGGPFWVETKDGETLQIVESSQVDYNDDNQLNILKKAAYFNPVDLVCSMFDFRGNKFDFRRYIDNESGFISVKSKDGKELKALELPGLWNGAMSGWNTIFVEVPLITFNPVKTINDLLRREHLFKE